MFKYWKKLKEQKSFFKQSELALSLGQKELSKAYSGLQQSQEVVEPKFKKMDAVLCLCPKCHKLLKPTEQHEHIASCTQEANVYKEI